MPNKILLIEDDSTMRTLLKTFLAFEGFDVVVFNGEESLALILALIKHEKPDLVLMDVYLNKLNGIDLLKLLRQDEKVENIGVVMTSGADFSEKCLSAGADAFVMKPYLPEELVKSIRRVIDSRVK